MLLLTLRLFSPLCSPCKDSVHRDLIQGKGTPIHLLPNGIASSRGEGWHSRCQGDGELLLLIIAVDGGNNLSGQQARQLSITGPLLFFHFWLLQSLLSIHLSVLHLNLTVCTHSAKLQLGEHDSHGALTETGRGHRWAFVRIVTM